MILTIYKRVLEALMKKPLTLWGISLLHVLLCALSVALCGAVPGAALAIILLLNTSMTMIFLRGYHGEDAAALQLFDCFRDWNTAKRVLAGMAWMTLWIFIWSLIPIAGPFFAVIRTYEYRLTPYILMTEPDISATEAYKESAKRTKGWKRKMFAADILPVVGIVLVELILALLAKIPYIGAVFSLIMFVFTLGWCALLPLFLGLVQAAYYEEIKNPTIIVRKPLPQHIEYQPGYCCPHCGAPLPPNSNFCTNCGIKLN